MHANKLIALILFANVGVTLFAQTEKRLPLDVFREFQSGNPEATPAADGRIPEWEPIEVKFAHPAELKLLFPANLIARHFPGRGHAQRPIAGEIAEIKVTLGRHSSYFKLVYGVRVEVRSTGSGESPYRGHWTAGSSFYGKRDKSYLLSEEFEKQVALALVDAVRKIAETGGSLP